MTKKNLQAFVRCVPIYAWSFQYNVNIAKNITHFDYKNYQ